MAVNRQYGDNEAGFVYVLPLAVFLGGIGGGMVFPILPILGVQLSLSAFFIGAILSANRVSRLFFNQPAGIMVDRLGGKKPLAAGFVIESLGCLCYVLALKVSFAGLLLLLGRIIWGIGSAFLFVGGNTLAINVINAKNRGRSAARVRTAQSLGIPGGLVAGGILASLWGDQAAFWVCTATALVAALFVLIAFPEIRIKRDKREDPGMLYTFKRMFRDKRLFFIGAVNFAVFFTLQGVLLATLVLFVNAKGLMLFSKDPRMVSGILMSIMMLASAGSGLLVGRLLERIRIRSSFSLAAIAVLVIGYALLATGSTIFHVITAMLLFGVGMGGTNVPLLTLLGDITPWQIRGKTVSIYQVLGDLGGTFGPVAGTVAAAHIGFSLTYAGIAAILLLFFPLVWYIYKKEQLSARRSSPEQ